MKTNESGIRLRNILVPIDFSNCMASALHYAVAFARECHAAVTLLHVTKPDGENGKREIHDPQLIEEMKEADELRLQQLANVLWGDEIVTDTVVATGKPSHQIVNEAREGSADLIIMASHGPVGHWELFHHNTVAKVIRTAPCPVLVVPAFERGSFADSTALGGFDN